MQRRDIIVVGASAGGVEALSRLAAGLPKDFPASVFVVLHTSPQSPHVMASVLERAGQLPASYAVDREPIRPGHVYIAPSDRHLLIEPGVVRVTHGPKENRFRPAVDPLFRSAAQVYGPRVAGVILTGGLDDGTSGLWAVKRLGGAAIVQDPDEAFSSSMPYNAMKHVKVDYCLPLAEIAPLLAHLAEAPAAEEEKAFKVPEEMEIEVKIAREDNAIEAGVEKLGEPSSFTCPECHGSLLQLKEGERPRFRCHTGHAFSSDSLLAELSDWIEDSLWTSIRSIEESVRLLRHMAKHLSEHGNGDAEMFLRKAQEAQERADLVRQAVFNHEEPSVESVPESADS